MIDGVHRHRTHSGEYYHPSISTSFTQGYIFMIGVADHANGWLISPYYPINKAAISQCSQFYALIFFYFSIRIIYILYQLLSITTWYYWDYCLSDSSITWHHRDYQMVAPALNPALNPATNQYHYHWLPQSIFRLGKKIPVTTQQLIFFLPLSSLFF